MKRLKKYIGNINDNGIELMQEIEKQKYLNSLEKEINILKNKISQEKQFNRKLELNKKLQELEKEKEKIDNG